MGYQIPQGNTTERLIFYLISSADHITGLTGKAGSVVVTLSKNGAPASAPLGAINELDATNQPGAYYVAPSPGDASTLGALSLHAKDAASDPYDDTFTVVPGTVTAPVRGQPFTAPFVMTNDSTHAPLAGLTVTANRSINNGAFLPCANSVVAYGNGEYAITLSAAEMALSGTVEVQCWALGADQTTFIVTVP